MKNNIFLPLSIKLTLFAFMLFTFQSCLTPKMQSIKEWERHEWKELKQGNKDATSWTIYKRKMAGTNYLEYKIEGDINASPNTCISVFRQDIHNLANGIDSKKYPIYEIVEQTEDNLLTYVIHKEPFPLKNTEMSIRYTFFEHEQGVKAVKWKEDWDACDTEPKKNLSRVQSFRGSWYFSPISDHLSKAVNSVHFDPKKMPKWLYEPMVFKFLKKGLADIKAKNSTKN